jgi:hypothetical protein
LKKTKLRRQEKRHTSFSYIRKPGNQVTVKNKLAFSFRLYCKNFIQEKRERNEAGKAKGQYNTCSQSKTKGENKNVNLNLSCAMPVVFLSFVFAG